jgi:hypothetical protein
VAADHDTEMRLAAVAHLQRVGTGGVVTADDLKAGFTFLGERILSTAVQFTGRRGGVKVGH